MTINDKMEDKTINFEIKDVDLIAKEFRMKFRKGKVKNIIEKLVLNQN